MEKCVECTYFVVRWNALMQYEEDPPSCYIRPQNENLVNFPFRNTKCKSWKPHAERPTSSR